MSLEYDNDLYHHNLGYNEINYEPYQGYVHCQNLNENWRILK